MDFPIGVGMIVTNVFYDALEVPIVKEFMQSGTSGHLKDVL
jgi:hypothetical protein